MKIISAIKSFLRKRALKKFRSQEPTSMMPLSSIHSATALLDSEDTSFDECKLLLQNFFRENDIKGEIFFLDMKKLGSGERLITSITGTILRKDLNWFGRLSKEKTAQVSSCESDLFISLVNNDDFTVEFISAITPAKFKLGRKQLPGHIFDMVISDPSGRTLAEAEAFQAMKSYLDKIK